MATHSISSGILTANASLYFPALLTLHHDQNPFEYTPQTIDLVQTIFISITFAILYWDWSCNVFRELELIWRDGRSEKRRRGSWSLKSIGMREVLLGSRYLTLLLTLLLLLVYIYSHLYPDSCTILRFWPYALTLTSFSAHTLMSIRVWAVWERRPSIGLACCIGGVVCSMVEFGLAGLVRPVSLELPEPLPRTCLITPTTKAFSLFFILPSVFHHLLLIGLVAKVFMHWRETRMKHGVIKSELVGIVGRQQVGWVLVICLINFANVILILQPDDFPFKFLNTFPSLALTQIFLSRIVFNLKQYARENLPVSNPSNGNNQGLGRKSSGIMARREGGFEEGEERKDIEATFEIPGWEEGGEIWKKLNGLEEGNESTMNAKEKKFFGGGGSYLPSMSVGMEKSGRQGSNSSFASGSGSGAGKMSPTGNDWKFRKGSVATDNTLVNVGGSTAGLGSGISGARGRSGGREEIEMSGGREDIRHPCDYSVGGRSSESSRGTPEDEQANGGGSSFPFTSERQGWGFGSEQQNQARRFGGDIQVIRVQDSPTQYHHPISPTTIEEVPENGIAVSQTVSTFISPLDPLSSSNGERSQQFGMIDGLPVQGYPDIEGGFQAEWTAPSDWKSRKEGKGNESKEKGLKKKLSHLFHLSNLNSEDVSRKSKDSDRLDDVKFLSGEERILGSGGENEEFREKEDKEDLE